jgi:hypothetical protein
MTLPYKIPGYFTTPTSRLQALERERERTQMNAERVAEQYARVLKAFDEEIAELKGSAALTPGATAQNESVAS